MKTRQLGESRVNASRRVGLRTRLGSESGMATAELALTFPAVILVIVALGLTGMAGMTQVQVSAAARAACRAVAIGEDTGKALAAGKQLLGRGGNLTVGSVGKDVHCVASQQLPSMLGLLGMTARSEAVIAREDSW
ncbi:TadE family type IV pilus minor pilin [Mobiluncus mulieris]|nr:TadE family type IV pilus minor pilin [Mobiluncus mulieris]